MVRDLKQGTLNTLDNVMYRVARRSASIRKILMEFDSLLWQLKGKPDSPPKLIKYEIIRNRTRTLNLETAVETGTYLGDFVAYIEGSMTNIYSIGISPSLYERAKKRFQKHPNVHLELGDSRTVLPGVLALIDAPSLFWLDAHYSGGITLGDPSKSPIMEELGMILDHSLTHGLDHLVMIDDAGDFVGTNGHPTIPEVDNFVKTHAPSWAVGVRDGMIHACKGTEI